MLYLLNAAVFGVCLLTLAAIKQSRANRPTAFSTITTEKGKDVFLKCPPTHRQENRKAYWFFTSHLDDSVQIKKLEETYITGVYKIPNIKYEDSGYWFFQRPPPSKDIYCQIKLVVKRKPSVSCKCDKPQPVREGEEAVRFDCTADGFPVPTVRWYRRDTPTLTLLTHGSVLAIYDVTRYAIGQYVCVATNSQGENSCEIDLDVNFQTEMEVYEEVLTVTPDQHNATLMCRVTGSSVSASTSESPVYWVRSDKRGEMIRSNAYYTVIQEDELLQSHHTMYVLLVVKTRQTDNNFTGTYLCRMGGYSLEKSVVIKTVN